MARRCPALPGASLQQQHALKAGLADRSESRSQQFRLSRASPAASEARKRQPPVPYRDIAPSAREAMAPDSDDSDAEVKKPPVPHRDIAASEPVVEAPDFDDDSEEFAYMDRMHVRRASTLIARSLSLSRTLSSVSRPPHSALKQSRRGPTVSLLIRLTPPPPPCRLRQQRVPSPAWHLPSRRTGRRALPRPVRLLWISQLFQRQRRRRQWCSHMRPSCRRRRRRGPA